MIIGRDLLLELGVIIDFVKKTITWKEATIQIHTSSDDILKHAKSELVSLEHEPQSTTVLTNRATRIMDVVYEAADLPRVVEKYAHLTRNEKINY